MGQLFMGDLASNGTQTRVSTRRPDGGWRYEGRKVRVSEHSAIVIFYVVAYKLLRIRPLSCELWRFARGKSSTTCRGADRGAV